MTNNTNDFERALRGIALAGDELARFVSDMRELAGPLDEPLARAHIAAMVAASQESRASAGPALRWRALRLAAVAAASLLALSALSTGLAVAGVVQIPKPARAALEHVGIHIRAEKHARPRPASSHHRPSPAPTASHSDPSGKAHRPTDDRSNGTSRGHEGSAGTRDSSDDASRTRHDQGERATDGKHATDDGHAAETTADPGDSEPASLGDGSDGSPQSGGD